MSAVTEAHHDLDARISQALRNTGMDSIGVADVLADLDAASTALTGEIAEARKDALSPLLDAKPVADAKAHWDDLSFRAERLSAARTALVARVEKLHADEKKARHDAKRDAALAERDALALTLSKEVPSMILRWTELVRDIASNDARLAAVGASMESAEAKARGYWGNGMWPDNAGMAHRLRDAKLPLFDCHGLAWGFDGSQDHWAGLES